MSKKAVRYDYFIMVTETNIVDLCDRLQLPKQDLAALSFCATKPSAVKRWAESLPATRIGYTSVLLYKVLPEFARLQVAPEKRMLMLESLRPYVQQCIEGLSKDFLNQPLLLSDVAIKAATVAQALQKHMSNAYSLCVCEFYRAKKVDSTVLLQALHRACSGLGLMLMRSYQLYTPTRSQIWHELYSLYLIAETQQLLDTHVVDPMLKKSVSITLQQVCLRAMLLACVRPNQLRQHEVSAVYDALELWVQHSKLVACGENNKETDNRETDSGEIDSGETGGGEAEVNHLHLVCLDLDRPPLYRTRYKGAFDANVRELDNRRLIEVLKDLQNRSDKMPEHFTPVLLGQLIQAWSLPSLRSFERLSSHAELDACVGLGGVYFHTCSHSDSSDKAAPDHFGASSVSAEQDPWDESPDSGARTMVEHTTYDLTPGDLHRRVQELIPVHSVQTLDTSPGGYCLNWGDDIPLQAKVGEVIGLKDKKRTKWNIGVIRWVRQSGSGTQMGVQLLAPMAEAIEVAMIQKSGDDNFYMRGLLLPALKAANQSATIITASMPFREHSKVRLKNERHTGKAQLQRRLFATSSISQFTYRELEDDSVKNSESAPQAPAGGFEESW